MHLRVRAWVCLGSGQLLSHLPGLLDGTVTPQHAQQQDEAEATHAPKVRVYAWATERVGQRLIEVCNGGRPLGVGPGRSKVVVRLVVWARLKREKPCTGVWGVLGSRPLLRIGRMAVVSRRSTRGSKTTRKPLIEGKAGMRRVA